MVIGYARVSTQDQDTAVQIAALTSAKCELIFQEKVAGGRSDRPKLHRLLGQLRKDDVLVVWKLDRLSRSLKDVLTLMEKVQQAGAGFSEPAGGDRYDFAWRSHDDADRRRLCRV